MARKLAPPTAPSSAVPQSRTGMPDQAERDRISTEQWFAQAACRPAPGRANDPDAIATVLMMTTSDPRGVSEEQRAMCAGCPVQWECLVDEDTRGNPQGVRAGLSKSFRMRNSLQAQLDAAGLA